MVNDRQCLLTYPSLDPVVALQPGQHVLFPSPEGLADSKQRQYTEELLLGVGLRLEQRAGRLFATRLKKCKVFWALSQQLDNGNPPPNLLCRDQETPIFDFHVFCTGGEGRVEVVGRGQPQAGHHPTPPIPFVPTVPAAVSRARPEAKPGLCFADLRDFRDNRRERSPDFTIFLCFGQCFSNCKPKESKLILVKVSGPEGVDGHPYSLGRCSWGPREVGSWGGALRGWGRCGAGYTWSGPLGDRGALGASFLSSRGTGPQGLPAGHGAPFLPQLVPKFCEHWYEQVQRQGASSLNSGNVSLQLSDSFSLYELIEQYNMQID